MPPYDDNSYNDALSQGAIPGEILPSEGGITLNNNQPFIRLMVINKGDRPIQVGSHYHFAEVNKALVFDREKAMGCRLDIPSGGAVRFEPGQEWEVKLIPFGGARRIVGFRGEVMGQVIRLEGDREP